MILWVRFNLFFLGITPLLTSCGRYVPGLTIVRPRLRPEASGLHRVWLLSSPPLHSADAKTPNNCIIRYLTTPISTKILTPDNLHRINPRRLPRRKPPGKKRGYNPKEKPQRIMKWLKIHRKSLNLDKVIRWKRNLINPRAK